MRRGYSLHVGGEYGTLSGEGWRASCDSVGQDQGEGRDRGYYDVDLLQTTWWEMVWMKFSTGRQEQLHVCKPWSLWRFSITWIVCWRDKWQSTSNSKLYGLKGPFQQLDVLWFYSFDHNLPRSCAPQKSLQLPVRSPLEIEF